MNLYEAVRIGAIEIRSHKLRALLTLSGIAVGITSIVAMQGITSGFQNGMAKSMQRLGTGRLFVTARATNDHTNRSEGLLYEDAVALRDSFPSLRVVSPVAETELTGFYRDFNTKVNVQGVTPEWRKLDWKYALHGRFFNETDLGTYAQVCILLKKYHKKGDENSWEEDPLKPLFRRYDPVGKFFRLGDKSFRVIGVLEELPQKDGMGMDNDNENVLLPLTSFQKRLSWERRQLSIINVDTGSPVSSYVLAKRIFALLKRRHRGVEDFEVMNMSDFMGPFLSWLGIASLVMGAVAAIALFAGGVGIMNISLASVNTRIKEIGIRKSVGAREKDIRLQFILEAAALSLLGGVLGIGLGVAASQFGRAAADMTLEMSVPVVGGALAASIVIGVAFSWYPALRAARLDAMEALRYE
ncbi:MAG: ABC transporter permease [Elusimicrobiota bacterium]